MEHPPKQGLKRTQVADYAEAELSFNGTSTKTRIETCGATTKSWTSVWVLMEHPPKQGLKHTIKKFFFDTKTSFNGTSTKTRIETKIKTYCCSNWVKF